MSTTIGILSIAVYVAWISTMIYERYQKDIKYLSRISLALTFEILYNLYMLYLLSIQSKTFLYIAFVSFMIHVSLGIYAEIFKPQVRINDQIMLKFWTYLGIDTGLSILTYFLVVNAGF